MIDEKTTAAIVHMSKTISNVRSDGFTIVELLIVIVIIAVLAAISIVAYTGIQNRATTATLQSDLRTASTQLGLVHADSDMYPVGTTVPSSLKASDGTTFQYTSSTGDDYCLTATSQRSGISPYHVSSTSGVSEGACAGHTAHLNIITNMHPNPSVEVSQSPFGPVGGSSLLRDSARAHSGSSSLRVTMSGSASAGTAGTSVLLAQPQFTTRYASNTTYTVSAWVYIPSGTVDVRMSPQGSGRSSITNPSERIATAKDTWVRIYNTFTTGASGAGNLDIYILNNVAVSGASQQFWVDDIMITQGSTLYTYADGSSPDWSWSGADQTSTSSGPAL